MRYTLIACVGYARGAGVEYDFQREEFSSREELLEKLKELFKNSYHLAAVSFHESEDEVKVEKSVERKTIKGSLNCCNCGKVFTIQDAEFCSNHLPRTLRCPHCNRCACHHVDKWKKEGKIVEVDVTIGGKQFDWLHKDLIGS